MAVNKVILGNETLLDLTGDTATESDVVAGKSFHLSSGVLAVGTADYADADHTHPASDIVSGTLPIARGGTGADTADDARANLRAVGYTTGMNATIANFNGANQQWGLRAKVINANNTDFLDHSTYIMLSNSGLRGYDATDQSYFWQLDLPSGTINLATTTQSVTPANSTATTFQLRKSGKVVQLVIYQLKVSSTLANGSNVSIAASGAIPSAYRPSSTLYAPCMANVANFGSGTFITIATGGGITLYNRAGASLATSTNLNCNTTWVVA